MPSSDTVTALGVDETVTLSGTPQTLTLAQDGGGRVLSLSCPDWSVIVGAPDTVTALIPSPELVVATCGGQGPPGPPGPPSPGSTYVWDQETPSALWAIQHNLGQYPSVTVIDSGGNRVDGDVQYASVDLVNLYFSVPFGGKALLN